MQESRGWPFWLAVSIIKPTLLATTKRTWIAPERLPETGGCVVAITERGAVPWTTPVRASRGAHLVSPTS